MLTSRNCWIFRSIGRVRLTKESSPRVPAPYKPVQNGAAWTLEANENWHGGFLGTIRHITLVKMTRADAADTSFRTGDVSIMRSARIAPDDQNIAFTGEVDTVPVSSAMLHYIGLNYNNSQFTNAKVRQALSMAISRQGLCATQLQDYADPAVLPINPRRRTPACRTACRRI